MTNIEEPMAISTVEVVQQKLDKNGSCEFQQGEAIWRCIYNCIGIFLIINICYVDDYF